MQDIFNTLDLYDLFLYIFFTISFISGVKNWYIAHPKFRDEFLHSIIDDPYSTKPRDYVIGKPHRNVIYYEGDVKLKDE